MTRRGRAGATPSTVGCATALPPPAGPCTCMQSPDRGRAPTRRPTPRSPAPSVGSPTVRSSCSTGFVASPAPEVLVPEAGRLRLVPLVHMPLGQAPGDDAREREAAVLSAATSVVTTSSWTRRFLVDLYSLPHDRVHVAEPGADRRRPRVGDGDGRGAALGRRPHPRQGPRRPPRRARADRRPALALPVRRQPGPRPGLRRGSAAPDRRRRDGRPGALLRAAHRRRSRRQLRRSGRARAPLAHGDVRDGRHRSARTRPPGHRVGRRRRAGGPRVRLRRDPAGAPRAARRTGRAPRGTPRLARGRRPAPAVAPGGARAAYDARPHGRRRRRSSPASSQERPDERRGDPGQPGLARPARGGGRGGPRAESSSGFSRRRLPPTGPR